MQTKETTLIGWQGVVVEVPKDWSLAAVSSSGSAEEYMRVDDPYATSYVEIKWIKPKGPIILEDVLDNFISRIKKEVAKKKISFQFRKRPAPPFLQRRDRETLVFSWRSDRKGIGRIWQCKECGKIVMAQIVGKEIPPGAGHILSSITDHPEDGKALWAFYGFATKVPETFQLVDIKLYTAWIMLSFKDKGRSLKIERYSIARGQLKSASLENWWENQVRRRLNGFSLIWYNEEYMGHKAMGAKGKRKIFGTMPPFGGFAHIYCWHCEEEDKIFLLEGRSKKESAFLEEVRDTIVCHS